ncbi:MAG: ABC transporter permease [Pyrinomonadaceae bacterium]
MLQLTIKKLIQGLLMVLVVSVITFTLLSSAGGDALSSLRDNPQISEKTVEDLKKVYGLDRPFFERYGSWLGGAVSGDLGESFTFRIPVRTIVWSRFLNTVILSFGALLISISISFLFAILEVRYKGRTLSAVIEAIILLTASTPRMVLALLALVFALQFSFSAPVGGGVSIFQLVAGSIVLALPLISIFLAQLRGGLADAMNEDYVRLAHAKGLSAWTVIRRHAIRAALNPFLTISGLSFGGLLGGSVIVESVLGWPGLGALMVGAVRSRDIPLVMGVVLVASVAVWLGNTIAEFLQVVNDKRLTSGNIE